MAIEGGGIPDEAKNALTSFAEIERRLAGRRPAVFLDYDGTLTPIVARPNLALLSDDMRETLRRLASAGTVAIVSGRDLADVRKLVGLDGLIYAGSHGFDIAGPNELRLEPAQGATVASAVARAAERLHGHVAGISGALVEPKRFAVAVHYRQAADGDVAKIEAAVDDALRDEPDLRKTHGKKVFELRPRFDWDKGKAVLWLLEALGETDADALPIYIGDDLTDEDAFAALRDRGVTIRVGHAADTAARYMLEDCGEVGAFLDRLARRAGNARN